MDVARLTGTKRTSYNLGMPTIRLFLAIFLFLLNMARVKQLTIAGLMIFLFSFPLGGLTPEAIAQASNPTLRKVVAVGDPTPIGGTFTFVGGLSPVLLELNDKNEVLFWAGVRDGSHIAGIFLFSDGKIQKVVAHGEPTPIGGTFNLLGQAQLNNRGEVAFPAIVQNGNSQKAGVFLWSDALIQKIALEGEIAPNPPVAKPLSAPDIFWEKELRGLIDINDKGEVVFNALQGKLFPPQGNCEIDENAPFCGRTGMYLFSEGSLKRILTNGDATELGALTLHHALRSYGPLLNNLQQVAFDDELFRPSPLPNVHATLLCTAGVCQIVTSGEEPTGPLDLSNHGDMVLADKDPSGVIEKLFLWSGGVLKKAVEPGDILADPAGVVLEGIALGDADPLNDQGQIVFLGKTFEPQEQPPSRGGVFLLSDGKIERIFLEGLNPTINNQSCIAFETFGAIWMCGVPSIDLDVDSDNTDALNLPDRSSAEESIEDVENDPAKPAKIVLINSGDKDNDGILDFADGFNWDGRPRNKDDLDKEDRFTPLVLELGPLIDLAKAKIKFAYSASDPAAVSSTAPPEPIHIPGPGHLRLWTKDGGVPRNKAKVNAPTPGDYVAPEEDYTATELGFQEERRVITLYSEGIARSSKLGEQRIVMEVDPDGDGPAGFDLTDAVRMTLLKLDLDGDTNRDGIIDEKDELDETKWRKGPKGRGAIVLPNADKDSPAALVGPDNWSHRDWDGDVDIDVVDQDWDRDGLPDPVNRRVDAGNDTDDLGPLWLSKLGPATLPDDLNLRLDVTKPDKPGYSAHIGARERLRIFLPTGVQGDDHVIQGANPATGFLGDEAVIGPEQEDGAEVTFVNPARIADAQHQIDYGILAGQGTVKFGAEGIEFGGLIDIRATLRLGAQELGQDTIRLKVTPYVLLDHTSRVEIQKDAGPTVYVTDMFADGQGNDNNDLIARLEGHFKDVAGTIYVDKPNILDPWHQDGYEIGYVKAPYGSMHVVLELPRARSRFSSEISKYIRSTLLRTNVGVNIRIAGFRPRTQDAGGNIESIPRHIPGLGPGKFFRGNLMQKPQTDFFAAQDVNDNVAVNTDWLRVQHVDEVVSIAPSGARAVVADPEVAWALILWASKVDGTAPMLQQMNNLGSAGIEVSAVASSTALRDFNMSFVMADNHLPKIRKKVAALLSGSEPESKPRVGKGNKGTAKLTKAGALVGFFPDTLPREYEIKFKDATRYVVRYRRDAPQAVWQEDPDQGSIDEDMVFRAAKAFLFTHWWQGAPASGDIFTFTADPGAKIVEMPVLFFEEGGEASAYTTNHVNGVADGRTFITGKAFGPQVDYRGTGQLRDIFDDYFSHPIDPMGILRLAGYDHVIRADARVYHNNCGSIHCGTNVRREIPIFKWWEK